MIQLLNERMSSGKQRIFKILPFLLTLMVFATARPCLSDGGEMVLEHDLHVTVDMESRRIKGVDRLLARRGEIRLILREGSSIERIMSDGLPAKYSVKEVR